ncbi:hypothetical protein bcgnr5390_11200 [Bacillus luti]|nr:hypothetical protein BC2903_29710 [Bacillus cereus]
MESLEGVLSVLSAPLSDFVKVIICIYFSQKNHIFITILETTSNRRNIKNEKFKSTYRRY